MPIQSFINTRPTMPRTLGGSVGGIGTSGSFAPGGGNMPASHAGLANAAYAGANAFWGSAGQQAAARIAAESALQQQRLQQRWGTQQAALDRRLQQGLAQTALQGQVRPVEIAQQAMMDRQLQKQGYADRTMAQYLPVALGAAGGAAGGGLAPRAPVAASYQPPAFQAPATPMLDLANYRARPVLSDAAVQRQVNATQARNDARAAGALRRAGAEAGGRGVGASSPLADALRAQLMGQSMAAGADAEREARMQAAMLNADDSRQRGMAQLQGQVALGGQALQGATSRYNADAARSAALYGSDVARYNAELDAMTNLAGSRNALLASLMGSLFGMAG